MTSSIVLTTNPEASSGTSRDIWIMWQGRLFGPYESESDAFLKDKFRFDGGEPLVDPFKV